MTRQTSDALEILDLTFPPTAEDLAVEAEFAFLGDLGQLAFNAREAAGLTRGQLGRKIGVKAAVIEDLELSDFDGDSAKLFARIMQALGRRIEVNAQAQSEPRRTARRKSA